MTALQAVLDDLETPLKPVARFFIEPTDKDPADEFARQSAFVRHMRRHCPSCLVAAVPNGSKDSRWTKLRKYAEGAHRGFPDQTIWWRPREVFIPEWKNGTKMPDDDQIETLNRLLDMGFRVGVYRTKETLLQHLDLAGAPVVFGGGK
ncbi:MAG: hypothetical protein ACOY4B_07500 [Pseudomonadota bacterium]|uniref:hypothetical protein n=1 Tax=uncultured Sphingomonas sp. TaxID=158754 RepID=UPI0030F8A83D